jgi:adenylate cyclase
MDQIKNRFFANLSHEFRTPLALTIGPLEDAIQGRFGQVNKRLRRQLEVMLRNSLRLLRLINQLLDISKIESGGMKLETGHYDIRQLVNDACLAFTPYAERKKILLGVESDDQPVSFDFDYSKMELILNNLLSNAIKFTPENGKVLLILKQADSPRQGVLLRVRDNGAGIESGDVDKIFDRFYQVDGSSSRDYEGTGIGLSLVKELVELHDGTIHVKSDIGFGTEFSVFFPGVVSNEQALPPAEQTSVAATELAMLDTGVTESALITDATIADGEERATVLVVDDNTDIRNYLQVCLHSTFNILQAGDGAEGLEMAQQHLPDLIISDIMMPGMDGYQLCQTIRQDEKLKHIPVIFLTAKDSDEMKLEGLEIGADDYLAKPFNARELLARSKNLITLRQQEKEVKQLNRVLEKKLKDQLEELVKNKKLSKYFSQKLLRRLLSADTSLDTERRNITILFIDLCGFTDMTDRIESEKVSGILNQYLSEMVLLIEQHGAALIQVIGDGLMVFLGAPEQMDENEQARRALNLSIAIQHKITELAKGWFINGLEYEGPARIGIHQDYVTVGNFGSQNMMEYTAVGRGINLASRLEASCTPGHIKVSNPVYLLTKDEFNYGATVEENFKGFSRKIRVCELDPGRMPAANTGSDGQVQNI